MSGQDVADALIHTDTKGALQLRPVVEINPRCTMGRLTLELRRYMVPEVAVTMRIYHARHATEAGHASLAEHITHLCATRPIVMEQGKIASGCIPLNDPAAARKFIAMLEC